MKKNEKLLIGFTCVVDFSVSSAKRYLCVIHSGSQKRIGTRKSSASPQASVTCILVSWKTDPCRWFMCGSPVFLFQPWPFHKWVLSRLYNEFLSRDNLYRASKIGILAGFIGWVSCLSAPCHSMSCTLTCQYFGWLVVRLVSVLTHQLSIT